MRRALVLLSLAVAACEPELPAPASAVGTTRAPLGATTEAYGVQAGALLGTSLAICPSRKLLVGAPGANPAQLYATTLGQPQMNTMVPLPLAPELAPGVSVSCGADYQVGAPGPEAIPNPPSAVYFHVTGTYDGGLGTRLGASMATLPATVDGGPERYVVGAPGTMSGAGAVLVYTNLPNPTPTPLVPALMASQLGTSVVVGDFNGDGRPDLAVGASAQVLLFFQQSSGSFTSSTLDLVPGGFSGKPSLGRALAVSPPRAGQRQQLAVGVAEVNSAYLVTLALDGGVDFSPILVGSPGALFGTAVAMGDWDQDGVVELFVSAPGDALGAGRVTRWVLDGGWRQLPADIVGPAPGSAFGAALAVGDLGGDPGPELVVGAPNFTNGFPAEGAYFVYAFDGGSDAGVPPNGCVFSSECPLWCGALQDCIAGACLPRSTVCRPGEVCGAATGVCVPLDGGSVDSGGPDAGRPDAGGPDAGPRDGGERDAGPGDGGLADAGGPDAGGRDAGGADAGRGDAGPADGGGLALNYQACGCSSAGPLEGALALLAHLAWRRRRLAA